MTSTGTRRSVNCVASMFFVGFGAGSFLCAGVPPAGTGTEIIAKEVEADNERPDSTDGSQSVSLTLSVAFGGYLVPNTAIVTAKVTNGSKPVSGASVVFWVQDGPHTTNPRQTVKTGADGTAQYAIPGDGFLGIDFVYAYVNLDGSTEGADQPIARPLMQQFSAADWAEKDAQDLRRLQRENGWLPDVCLSNDMRKMASLALPASAGIGGHSLGAMRHFRDTVLMPTDRGRCYVRLYYADSPEVAGLVLRHPSLLPRMAELMARCSPRLQLIDESGLATFTESELAEIDQVLSDLGGMGGPQLRADLDAVRRDLRDDAVRREFHIVIGSGRDER